MARARARACDSSGTTKGTGGDAIILEEAAYVDQNFFYETVAPLLLIGVTSLICISTLTSELNFYTRLFKIKDPVTGLPVFTQLQVALVCSACREAGLASQCKHMLHLVPQWQSSARHERLKAVMADRPDLIQSELAGLAFDALQQCFRASDIDALMAAEPPNPLPWREPLFMVIDPAAGGPQSDFALVTFFRHRGQIVVRISRAHVLHLQRALKVVQPLRLIHEEEWHELSAQHLQEADRLVGADWLKPRVPARFRQYPIPKTRLEVEHEKEEAAQQLRPLAARCGQQLAQLRALLLRGHLLHHTHHHIAHKVLVAAV